VFIDLRDRAGIVQVSFDPDFASPQALELARGLGTESVVLITGEVVARPAEMRNAELESGDVEVRGRTLRLVGPAETPVIPVARNRGEPLAAEELRLRHRHLDLRRPELRDNIILRHTLMQATRAYLSREGFVEIETPILTKPTPEGARDYLVPSRVHPGEFYALPQSPQLYKQLLMVSGFDRYFQIARCFRDEDLRADRQPEFTQIDLEMTFPQQETIFAVVEGFLKAAFHEAGVDLVGGFPRMSFDEAIRLYGIDKPDMRLPAMTDVRSVISPQTAGTLKTTAALPVIAVRIPNVGELSRKERDDLRLLYPQKLATQKIKVLDDFKRLEKSFPEEMAKVRTATGAQEGDLLVLVVADSETVPEQRVVGKRLPARDRELFEAAGQVRLALAQQFASRHRAFEKKGTADDYKFLWVTDFPMFEWDEDGKTWVAAHHPFTSPDEDDLKAGRLTSDPGAVRALAYDIVLNGTELGSGSIRIHQRAVQSEIFRALGMTDEEAKERFGFFLEALTYGTPPHGGIALGLDRIAMILAGAPSLREVIAFPKTAKAIDLMVDAPTPVSDTQLRELHIRPVLKG
jgi:aspartyl-tRNA synthetase